MRVFSYSASQKRFVLQDVPMPRELDLGEVLVKVSRAGICATDIEIIKGYKQGFRGTLGHEFIGKVISINENGESCPVRIGDRVTAELNICCESCDFCLGKNEFRKRNHCRNRQVIGIWNSDQGAFADYLICPLKNLITIPEGIPEEIAVFVEPLAAAYRIIEQGSIDINAGNIAVIGDGKLGLLVALVLSLSKGKSAKVSLIGKHEAKLQVLEGIVDESIKFHPEINITHCNQYDACVAVTGSIHGIDTAVNIVKPLGIVVLKSTCSPNQRGFDFTAVNNQIVVKEVTIQGSRCGPFGPTISFMKEKLSIIAPTLRHMIAETYDLSEIETAIKHASRKGVLKVQIKME